MVTLSLTLLQGEPRCCGSSLFAGQETIFEHPVVSEGALEILKEQSGFEGRYKREETKEDAVQ